MSFRKNLKSTSLLLLGICLIAIGFFLLSPNKNNVVQVIPQAGRLASMMPSFTYAKVTRVIDGDTIVIDTG
jgi:endonuclease YncB( thermonuclease family)